MSRSKSHRAAGADPLRVDKLPLIAERLPVGMPALDSITGVDVIVKGKKRLLIIHTNEVDAYEASCSTSKKRKT